MLSNISQSWLSAVWPPGNALGDLLGDTVGDSLGNPLLGNGQTVVLSRILSCFLPPVVPCVHPSIDSLSIPLRSPNIPRIAAHMAACYNCHHILDSDIFTSSRFDMLRDVLAPSCHCRDLTCWGMCLHHPVTAGCTLVAARPLFSLQAVWYSLKALALLCCRLCTHTLLHLHAFLSLILSNISWKFRGVQFILQWSKLVLQLMFMLDSSWLLS